MIPIELILDGIVAALLIVTVAYCFVLERKLRALRSGQDGMKTVIEALDQATSKAEASLAHLKTEGVDAGALLKEQVVAAEALADELKLMVQAGDRVADRLAEAGSPKAGGALKALPGPAKTTSTRPVQGEPDEDDELFDALHGAR